MENEVSKPKKPILKRWWFWFLVICLAFGASAQYLPKEMLNIFPGLLMVFVIVSLIVRSTKRSQRKQAEAKQKRTETDPEFAAKTERLSKLDAEGVAYCPKCGSTSLSADKKGFGIGKAVAGAWVAGPIGLVAGNLGAKNVRVTCLKCGKQFWAGKR